MIDPVVEFLGIVFAPIAVIVGGAILGGVIVIVIAGSIANAFKQGKDRE